MDIAHTTRNVAAAECPSVEIAAYIDGELSPESEMSLELHFAACRICSEDLNLQKQFVNALDISLKAGPELPADFTRRVVANAESNVQGLRRGNERLSAMFVCSALFIFVLFALGASAPGAFASGFDAVSRTAAVAGFFGHLVYDVSIGVVVILRSFAAQPAFGAAALLVMVPLTIGLAYRYTQARTSRERVEYSESGSSL
jgi:anti-sigma factor RsiW